MSAEQRVPFEDAQSNVVVIGRYPDIGIGPAVVFDGGVFNDPDELNAMARELMQSAEWLADQVHLAQERGER